jgi:phosphate uptake regulator
MSRLAALDESFRFIILEVTKQIESTRRQLDRPDDARLRRIKERDDYIDQLKSRVENRCFSVMRRSQGIGPRAMDMMRAMIVIASNLERIADKAVNIVSQVQYFQNADMLKRFDYGACFDVIERGLSEIGDAYANRDLPTALRICQYEGQIDDLYERDFKRILRELERTDKAADLVTVLLVLHYLEGIGDCLLNIGEAIIFARVGEKLKYYQYQALDEAMASVTHGELDADDVDFHGIWGTRSGCRIGRISTGTGPEDLGREVIFKSGNVRKLSEERGNIDRWNRIVPGISPEVVEFRSTDQVGALLTEYLHGPTIQDIVLDSASPLLEEAFETLFDQLTDIWKRTMERRPVPCTSMQQLTDRLEDIYAVHPEFNHETRAIGAIDIPSFAELVTQGATIESQFAAPFAVFAHGDFNCDNIIYDPEERTVHFIDVHRSDRMDYVQDVSVFLVSNFRVPVFARKTRKRLNDVGQRFLDFASDFAAAQDDTTFEPRLAFGLVRSFATSTRFQLERAFAENMHHRATLLLRLLIEHTGDDWTDFVVPRDIIMY